MPSLPIISRASSNMMGSVAAKAAQAIKPHVPMIKFPPRNAAVAFQGGASNATPSFIPPPTSASGKPVAKGVPIESSSLPPRYHRKPLSMEEIEYIEKGGPV